LASKQPADPLRARLFDLIAAIEQRTATMRDFAATPGSAWLAKNELQALMSLLSDLDTLIEDIKQSDAESGY
jgi:hypothetical protein